MKTSRSIFIFTIINLICTIVFINFLPERVIFGLTGNLYASEYIGKWYNLIIPVVQLIAALAIFLIDIFAPKYHKYRYLTAWVAISFTTYLLWILMFLQYENSLLGVKLIWPWTIIILFPIGLFLLAEGYYTINKSMDDFSIYGFSFVKNSSLVWKKTHRVAGVSLIIFSLVMITLSVLNEIFWHVWWIYLIVILIWFFAHYLYTVISANNYARKFGTK